VATSPEKDKIRFGPLAIILIVLGIIFAIVAVYYAIEPSKHLMSWFPGYAKHSKQHHWKRAIAAGLLAIVAFVGAWFATTVGED
jgi:hypothetical protein